MFTNIYKKLLDARAVEIQNMLSTAILDQKLRNTEKHERYWCRLVTLMDNVYCI
jgi:hypothetical protein